MEKIKQYNANAIDVLDGLDAIRKRCDMYVGSATGDKAPGLYRICREAIDNSLDEYLGGHNKQLYVFYDSKTFETIVLDNGRGIPVGYSAKAKMDALTAVVSKIHAGGKFDHDVYKTSSGKNGVGITALNALSKRLQIWSNNSKNGKWHTQVFERGKAMSDVLQNDPPKELMKLVPKTGTILKWTPDSQIFKDSLQLNTERLRKELNDIQFLCPGLHIHLIIDGEEEQFYSEDGLAELVAKSPTTDTIFTFSDEFTDVAINFTKGDGSSFKSFVNICYTDLGGTHLQGLKRTITDYIKTQSKQKLINEDILDGVIGVIHHRLAEPQYTGQTKNELTNSGVDREIQEKLTPALEKFFKKNKDTLKRIVTMAEKLLEQRNKMKHEKDMLKGLKELNASSRFISDKFLDADRRKHKNPKDLEMFIVEGDSAGGHMKQARESFQGLLKLRGKPINAQSKKPEDLFGKPGRGKDEGKEGNREIKDLVAALGCGIGENYDESKLRFNKVVMLCFTGDTKVKMLDGTNKTFEELVAYENENPNSEYWVYSVNDRGEFIPGKAKYPRITGYTKEIIELTFDNGAIIKCTPDHLFMLRDGTYKAAKDITANDSLMPLYTSIEDGFYNTNHEKIYNNLTGKWEFTHQVVSECFNGEREKGYHIHHIDMNPVNNIPDNLTVITKNKHSKIHSNSVENLTRIINYNKSDKHKERISYLWKNTDAYKNCTFSMNGYNGSEKHKNDVKNAFKEGKYAGKSHFIKYNEMPDVKEFHKNHITSLNKDSNMNLIRLQNKMLNIGMFLHLNGYALTENLFNNKTLIKQLIGSCPDLNLIIEKFGSFNNYKNKVLNKLTELEDDAVESIKNKKFNVNEIIENRIKTNVYTKKNSMAKIGKAVYDRGLEFNEENYMKVRKELGSIRVPIYKNFINYYESENEFAEYCKNYNHKIISKKILTYENEIPVYDLTVEGLHNFLLADANVIVHNCDADVDGEHIQCLILAFFIKYMPDLIKQGHLYIVDAPLFIANGNKCKAFGSTRAEVDNKMKKLKCSDYTIYRLKGWGECSASLLSELCLNPKTRKLIQIEWSDDLPDKCEQIMGNDSSYRKELLGVK